MRGTRRDSRFLGRPLMVAACGLIPIALVAAPAAAQPATVGDGPSAVTRPLSEATSPATKSEPVEKAVAAAKGASGVLDGPTGGLSEEVIHSVTGVTGLGSEDKGRVKGRKNARRSMSSGKEDKSMQPGNAGTGLTAASRVPMALPDYVIDRNRAPGFELVSTTAHDLTGSLSTAPGSSGILEQIARAAADAAKKAALPLALLLSLAAFILFHGRFDGRDPKLALAPVDGETTMLGFE